MCEENTSYYVRFKKKCRFYVGYSMSKTVPCDIFKKKYIWAMTLNTQVVVFLKGYC